MGIDSHRLSPSPLISSHCSPLNASHRPIAATHP
uniref:Uncharacterized protein n=1 Tax=Arundo donax TaxID=35708 RepID=A0A0A8ZJI2_ARUDO